ncbi:MAG: beta-glucoside-specific PTS transporter subunit IIABC [Eubacteriales bacterium]|nr:beta-glucoside-specific PTS transporter subunit IIABC [Eubacteriales bacterium]
MALDYVKTSKDILEAVGGKANVSSATHCMTRLRLVLKDESKADDKKVEAIKGVKSIIKQGGQYQVVIGNEVSNLFKEFEKLGNFSGEGGAEAKPTGSPIQRLFGFVAGCMTPLLPAMLGTGMVKVLLTLLTTFGVMEATGPTYIILYGMADAFFYFLPIFLSVTIAKKMKGSIPLFMVIGAMFCAPDIVNLLANGTELYPLGTFLGMPCTYLFGFIPVISATYTSSVLPILLMAPVMKWVEDFADRVSPNVLKSFLKPMIFCLICTPIALCILGPIGAVAGNGLASVFSAMYNTVPWLTVAILSAAMPFIVMTGMHYALIPLCMNNLATIGYDVIVMVTMFASNIAQGGAAFGVAAKTKDTDIRSEGIACGISATVAGVTEPAMYGVNLRFGKPMIGAVVGAGLSGLFLGLAGVKGFTMGGSPSFLTSITFIGGEVNPMRGLYFGLIGGAISVVVSFLISMFLYKDEVKAEETSVAEEVPAAEEKKSLVEKLEIAAPMSGKVVALSEVPDQVFASGALGAGAAIIPEDGKVYAPFDGVISATMDTGHAVGITGTNGVDILIHVGLDTVSLEGEPFKYAVKEGEKVSKGQLLLTADLDMIRAKGFEIHTPVIVTNTDDYMSVKKTDAQKVKTGEQLITVV